MTSLKPPIPRPSSSTIFTKFACDVVSGRGRVPGIFHGLPKVLNNIRDTHFCIYFAGMEFPMCAAALNRSHHFESELNISSIANILFGFWDS